MLWGIQKSKRRKPSSYIYNLVREKKNNLNGVISYHVNLLGPKEGKISEDWSTGANEIVTL